MNTLTTEPLRSLLQTLFDEDRQTKATLKQEFEQLSKEDRQKLMKNTDPLALYRRAKNVHLAVSPSTARLLYILARSSSANTIVEFGTSFGISTLHLAAAINDNGGGQLISTEFESSKVLRARKNMNVRVSPI